MASRGGLAGLRPGGRGQSQDATTIQYKKEFSELERLREGMAQETTWFNGDGFTRWKEQPDFPAQVFRAASDAAYADVKEKLSRQYPGVASRNPARIDLTASIAAYLAAQKALSELYPGHIKTVSPLRC